MIHTCLKRGCVRSSHERQKQKKSEMKGLILIRLSFFHSPSNELFTKCQCNTSLLTTSAVSGYIFILISSADHHRNPWSVNMCDKVTSLALVVCLTSFYQVAVAFTIFVWEHCFIKSTANSRIHWISRFLKSYPIYLHMEVHTVSLCTRNVYVNDNS